MPCMAHEKKTSSYYYLIVIMGQLLIVVPLYQHTLLSAITKGRLLVPFLTQKKK